MIILRLAFWGLLCSYLLTNINLPTGDLPAPYRTGEAQSDAIVPDIEPGSLARIVHKAQNLCTDSPKVCELRDAAFHYLHVKAADLTGALHTWLADGLEET